MDYFYRENCAHFQKTAQYQALVDCLPFGVQIGMILAYINNRKLIEGVNDYNELRVITKVSTMVEELQKEIERCDKSIKNLTRRWILDSLKKEAISFERDRGRCGFVASQDSSED